MRRPNFLLIYEEVCRRFATLIQFTRSKYCFLTTIKTIKHNIHNTPLFSSGFKIQLQKATVQVRMIDPRGLNEHQSCPLVAVHQGEEEWLHRVNTLREITKSFIFDERLGD